ncbi:hypothetical protein HYH02_005859 [Chlamydomonas schloesseri]|uniref:GATA-type domain-containing protein n=1 Tax=Chlamydomonas schloesseri TaxID=2026947 RepID=A0A835WKJ3_9CHLO|nr:hypothetical protein HYH02_005859 [Chlamydomonas schloesseri]|eukprot:KAG2449111.1 hypothetical protein HYH02_005859 [Chlamydomonas schloesseri]
MATTQHMSMFDEGDAGLFGDLFGSNVPCLAGELELQVQSYECGGDTLAGGDPAAAGKSFSLTKDSNGSSLSALGAGGFGDGDFMDGVSLDDIAAADHYGHTVCGRQSTADSAAARTPAQHGASWNAAPHSRASVPAMRAADPQQGHNPPNSRAAQEHHHNHNGHESSDCDMSHTAGDGESSGVGPGKGLAQGSSHSEASEDNTAGLAASASRDEEHVSMPSYGLSLTRLTQNQQSSGKPEPPAAAPGATQEQQQPQAASVATAVAAGSSAAAMPRALSVDNFAMTSATSSAPAAGPAAGPAADAAGGRAAMYRSFSCVATDTLPMDFSLGYGDGALMGASCSGGSLAFGARGRSVSLNETQLRRQQWLHEGELLAPRLPPSVSELELLELPEDPVPLRPFKCASFLGGLNTMADSSLTASAAAAANAAAVRPMTSGMMQFKGAAGAPAAADAGGAGAVATTTTTTTNNNGVTVTVKRKIITSPSPLLQQGKAKARQPAPPAAAAPAGMLSPKRAKVGGAGGFGGWQQPGAGGMKVVRSVPSNMNNFLEGVEVSVQPMGHTGADSVVSPNASSISASTPNAHFGTGPFFDPAAAARGSAAVPAGMLAPQAVTAAAGKGGKSKAAVLPAGVPVPVPPVQGVGPVPPGMIPGLVPGTFMAPGMAFPEAKRPVPSVPKPRKRASPNGNPPKAPAPNPNGHCCTQCGTQTTPVWRAGPHGPKTLCNACGVRYMKVAKSGATQPAPRRQQQQQHQ